MHFSFSSDKEKSKCVFCFFCGQRPFSLSQEKKVNERDSGIRFLFLWNRHYCDLHLLRVYAKNITLALRKKRILWKQNSMKKRYHWPPKCLLSSSFACVCMHFYYSSGTNTQNVDLMIDQINQNVDLMIDTLIVWSFVFLWWTKMLILWSMCVWSPRLCRVCVVRFFRNRIASLFHRKRNTRKSPMSVSCVCGAFFSPFDFSSLTLCFACAYVTLAICRTFSPSTTIRCKTLQHAATHCWFEEPLGGDGDDGDACLNTHAATYCNTLQHTAGLKCL